MSIVAVDREFEKDILHVDWFIGKRCNFDCDYCPDGLHDNYSPHYKFENTKKLIDTFLNKFAPSDIRIGFTGGEPTVNPDFLKVCEYASSKGIRLNATTNGTRTSEYYKALLNFLSHLTVSQHFGQHNIYDLHNKVKQINSDKVTVQVMAHAQFFDQVKESTNYYENNNINHWVMPVDDRRKDNKSFLASNYSEDYYNWLQTKLVKHQDKDSVLYFKNNESKKVHTNEILGDKLNRFKNWICYAGVYYLNVWQDGNVYRGICGAEGTLGNANTGTFNLPSEPVKCPFDTCDCSPGIHVKKVIDQIYNKVINV